MGNSQVHSIHKISKILVFPWNLVFLFIYFYFLFFCFWGPHPQHIDVPKLGVESELRPLVYTTSTATPDPSRVWDLHHGSQQHGILNPLSEAGDWTHNLMIPSWIRFRCTTMGIPESLIFFFLIIHLFFGQTWNMWKFLGQGVNVRCNCHLRHSWGNTGSLTHRATRELPKAQILKIFGEKYGQSFPWSGWLISFIFEKKSAKYPSLSDFSICYSYQLKWCSTKKADASAHNSEKAFRFFLSAFAGDNPLMWVGSTSALYVLLSLFYRISRRGIPKD